MATPLQSPYAQFFDDNGNPLAGGKVYTYVAGTTTNKATYTEATESPGTQATNPVILDGSGRALIWGDGAYRQVVKASNGDLIWDQVTSSIGTGGSTTTTVGDGLPVGSILPNSGFIAPAKVVLAFGKMEAVCA